MPLNILKYSCSFGNSIELSSGLSYDIDILIKTVVLGRHPYISNGSMLLLHCCKVIIVCLYHVFAFEFRKLFIRNCFVELPIFLSFKSVRVVDLNLDFRHRGWAFAQVSRGWTSPLLYDFVSMNITCFFSWVRRCTIKCFIILSILTKIVITVIVAATATCRAKPSFII